jgi:hypothetical protein
MTLDVIFCCLMGAIIATAWTVMRCEDSYQKGVEDTHEQYKAHDVKLGAAQMRINYLEQELAIQTYMHHSLVLASIKEDSNGERDSDGDIVPS